MELSIAVEGVHGEVIERTLIIRFNRPMKTLSSAILHGGLLQADAIICHGLPEDYDDEALHAEGEAEQLLERIAKDLGLPPENIVGLITGVVVSNVATVTQKLKGLAVTTVATGGLGCTAATAGDTICTERSSHNEVRIGTINIIVLVDGDLTDTCMVNAVKTITEAEAVALRELDVRSSFTGELASGTITDSIVIACTGRGQPIKYAGTFTTLGMLIGQSVKAAVKAAIEKQENNTSKRPLISERPLIRRLEERGIGLDDLLVTVLELRSELKNGETQRALKESLTQILSDPTITALTLAGLRLEEDAKHNLIPGLNSELLKTSSPSFEANRILGQAIAKHIEGPKAITEYARFAEAKPGLLKRLGPFSRSVICGIVAGISSKYVHRKR